MIKRKINDDRYLFQCPDCRGHGYIDRDQAKGKVSIQCTNPKCDYHETKNWLKKIKW